MQQAEYSIYPPDYFDGNIELIETTYPLQYLVDMFKDMVALFGLEKEDVDIGKMQPMQHDQAIAGLALAWDLAFRCLGTRRPNPDQYAIIYEILSAPGGSAFHISGRAGTGKSLISEALYHTYVRREIPHFYTASTGVAAVSLGCDATTVHSGFGIKPADVTPLDQNPTDMHLPTKNPLNFNHLLKTQEDPEHVHFGSIEFPVKVVLIDEISMADPAVLYHVFARIIMGMAGALERDRIKQLIHALKTHGSKKSKSVVTFPYLLPGDGHLTENENGDLAKLWIRCYVAWRDYYGNDWPIVIFVGDFLQLPPVGDNIEFAFKSPWWGPNALNVRTLLLTVNMRAGQQARWATYLNLMSQGRIGLALYPDFSVQKPPKPSEPDDQKRQRLIDSNDPRYLTGTHIFAWNKDCDDYNRMRLKMVSEQNRVPIYTIFAEDSGQAADRIDRNILRSIEICVGARIIITLNLETTRGICNGSVAKITRIGRHDFGKTFARRVSGTRTWVKDYPVGLDIPMRHALPTKDGEPPRIQWFDQVPPLTDKLSPTTTVIEIEIEQTKERVLLANNVFEVTAPQRGAASARVIGSRRQFRFILGWGVTCHRTQGLTIQGTVIVHPERMTQNGHRYTAFSRVPNPENLFITSLVNSAMHDKLALDYDKSAELPKKRKRVDDCSLMLPPAKRISHDVLPATRIQ